MRQVIAGASRGETDAATPLDEPGAHASACLDFYAKLASGVSVVTAQGRGGPVGSTVSAVTSLAAPAPAARLSGNRFADPRGDQGAGAVAPSTCCASRSRARETLREPPSRLRRAVRPSGPSPCARGAGAGGRARLVGVPVRGHPPIWRPLPGGRPDRGGADGQRPAAALARPGIRAPWPNRTGQSPPIAPHPKPNRPWRHHQASPGRGALLGTRRPRSGRPSRRARTAAPGARCPHRGRDRGRRGTGRARHRLLSADRNPSLDILVADASARPPARADEAPDCSDPASGRPSTRPSVSTAPPPPAGCTWPASTPWTGLSSCAHAWVRRADCVRASSWWPAVRPRGWWRSRGRRSPTGQLGLDVPGPLGGGDTRPPGRALSRWAVVPLPPPSTRPRSAGPWHVPAPPRAFVSSGTARCWRSVPVQQRRAGARAPLIWSSPAARCGPARRCWPSMRQRALLACRSARCCRCGCTRSPPSRWPRRRGRLWAGAPAAR